MIRCGHQLQVRGQVFVLFVFLAFEVEIPELDIEALVVQNSGNHDEATIWRPFGYHRLIFNPLARGEREGERERERHRERQRAGTNRMLGFGIPSSLPTTTPL